MKPPHWGFRSQVPPGLITVIIVLANLGVPRTAAGDAPIGTPPDPPPRAQPIKVSPARFRPSWDLDGTYLWLGPVGAASHVDQRWDSTIGGQAAVGVVREQAPISFVGAALGASRWTARGGGRIWLDGAIGTRALGPLVGASLGPLLELSELAHPRLGASIGVWGYAGVAPFARLGAVSGLGFFAEVGIYLALPVLGR